MKVQVYEEPQAHPETRVPGSVQLERPTGYDAIAHGVDKAASGLSSLYEKYQHEARSADVANGVAGYVQGANDDFHGAPSDPSARVVGGSTPALQATPGAIDAATAAGERTVQLPGIANPVADTGFLGTRGKAAAAAEAPLFDSLKQRRDKIAAGFSDPETKQLFLDRVQEIDLQYREKAESHVGQQVEVAKEDAAKNITDAAVRSAAADPGNDALAATLFGEARGAVGALGRGQDFDALHDRVLRADIAGTRIDSLLAPDGAGNISRARIDKAQEVLDANRTTLGDKLRPLEQRINLARKGDDKQDLANAAEAVAQTAMKDAVDPLTGHVDEAKLWARVDEVPDVKERDNVRQRARARLTEQGAVFKQNTDTVLAAAHAEYNRVGSVTNMSAQTLQVLNNWPDKEAPAMLDAFIAKDRERFRLARSSRSEANKEQREANEEALKLFNAQGSDVTSQPDSVDQFLAKFPKNVNDLGRSALVLAQRQGKNVADKGQAISENVFVEQTLREAKGWRPENAHEATVWSDKMKSDAVNAFAAYMEDHDGKPPDKAEAAKIRARLILEQTPTTDEQAASSAGAAAILGGGSRGGIGAVPKSSAVPPAASAQQRRDAFNALKKAGVRDVDDAMVDNYLKRKVRAVHAPVHTQPPAPTTNAAADAAAATGDYGLDLTTKLPETAAAEDLP